MDPLSSWCVPSNIWPWLYIPTPRLHKWIWLIFFFEVFFFSFHLNSLYALGKCLLFISRPKFDPEDLVWCLNGLLFETTGLAVYRWWCMFSSMLHKCNLDSLVFSTANMQQPHPGCISGLPDKCFQVLDAHACMSFSLYTSALGNISVQRKQTQNCCVKYWGSLRFRCILSPSQALECNKRIYLLCTGNFFYIFFYIQGQFCSLSSHFLEQNVIIIQN